MSAHRSSPATIPTTKSGPSSGSPMFASIRRAVRMSGALTLCVDTRTTSNPSACHSTWYSCRFPLVLCGRRTKPHVLIANGPEWQLEIDSLCGLIERLAAAGIPAAKYNLSVLGVLRTAPELGRGGSRNKAFRWSWADPNASPTLAGVISEEENWERIDRFLAAVVPVATATRVRLACHPHDPHTPPGWRGVTRVLGTVDELKRFVTMHESPYHGLNFCQGTVSEMLR